ncbi:MAG: EamA family transporter [Thaumarchaeota archaeon]|nr:EamA family transporter [Nitrososphaerota archaeon]
MRKTSKSLGVLAISSAAIIWGSNGVIVNFLPLDAFTIAFFRVLLASIILLPFMLLFRRVDLLRIMKGWKLMILNGLLLCLGWAFLFASMKLISIANAVLLNYLAPIFTAILSPIILKERLEKSAVIALILSFIGVLLISQDELLGTSASNLLGIAYGLLAGLSYAGFIIVSKRLRGEFSSLLTAFYSYVFAAVFLALMAQPASPTLSPYSWLLLLMLAGVNTSSAVTLYLYGLGSVEAHRAVILTYLEPLSAAIFGLIFLGQVLGIFDLIGGALILVSGYLVARS